jgi:hypothetical protein
MDLIDPKLFCDDLIPKVEKSVLEHLILNVDGYQNADDLGGSTREWGKLLGIIGDWTKEHLSTKHDTDKKSQGEWRLPFDKQGEYAMEIGTGSDASNQCRRKLRGIARTYLFISPTSSTIIDCEKLCTAGKTTLNFADVIFACADFDSGRITRLVKIRWLDFLKSSGDPYSISEFARYGCITPGCLRNNFLNIEFNVAFFKSWHRHFGNEVPIAMWFSDQNEFIPPFEPKRGTVPVGFDLNISIPNWALRFSFYNPHVEDEWKGIIPQHGLPDLTHSGLLAEAASLAKMHNVADTNEFAIFAEEMTIMAISNCAGEWQSLIPGYHSISNIKNNLENSTKLKKSELARARGNDRRFAMEEAEAFLVSRLTWFPRVFSQSIAGYVFLADIEQLIEPEYAWEMHEISLRECSRAFQIPNYGSGFHTERLLGPHNIFLYQKPPLGRIPTLQIDCFRKIDATNIHPIEPDAIRQILDGLNWERRLDLTQDFRKFALEENSKRQFHIAKLPEL